MSFPLRSKARQCGSCYDQKLSNMDPLFCDNWSRNQAFGRMIRAMFIGCHSYWFHFVLKDIIYEKRERL